MSSVLDPKTLNLDPDPGQDPGPDPDPGLYVLSMTILKEKNLK